MSAVMLVARLHVDLQRVHSAACCHLGWAHPAYPAQRTPRSARA